MNAKVMKILYIETSSKIIEFGISAAGDILIMKKLHSEYNADSLIYNILRFCREKDIRTNDLDAVSISNGPGSFTGLRIGLSIAKGICFVQKSKLIQIPTLDVIANKYKALLKDRFTALVFSNSRTNEFYCRDYEISEKGLIHSSDFYINKLEDIYEDDKTFVINEKIESDFAEKSNIIYTGEEPNIPSLFELTGKYIESNLFSDAAAAEPLYLKDFIPLKKVY